MRSWTVSGVTETATLRGGRVPPTDPAWQDQFVRTILPVVEQNAEFHFRRLARDAREEAVAEAVAAAVTSCASLVARGKDPTRFPLTDRGAVLHVRNGRHVGGHAASNDLMSVARREYFVRRVSSSWTKNRTTRTPVGEKCWSRIAVLLRPTRRRAESTSTHGSKNCRPASESSHLGWPTATRLAPLPVSSGFPRAALVSSPLVPPAVAFQGQVPAAENELPAAA